MGQVTPGACPGLLRLVPGGQTISGLLLAPLRVIPTNGGPVLHMLRADSPLFSGFGEVYFSEATPGALKAWKRHRVQTQLFAVPVGRLDFVVYDARETSPTQGKLAHICLGRPDAYCLLRIPPLLWYGFAARGASPALVANVADRPHNPAESDSLPADTPEIPFSWPADGETFCSSLE